MELDIFQESTVKVAREILAEADQCDDPSFVTSTLKWSTAELLKVIEQLTK